MGEIGRFENFELKIPSDRVFSGLSEYYKIIQIGQTELKLWPLEHGHRYVYTCVCVHLEVGATWIIP